MIKDTYMRSDEQGRLVQVEFWKDGRTGKLVMLRKITYLEGEGNTRKFRTDIPIDSTEAFEAALKEEVTALARYANILQNVLDATQYNDEPARSGLANTVARISRM